MTDIDFDDQNLYDYVVQLDAIENDIKNAGPKNPSTFGKMAEPFTLTSPEGNIDFFDYTFHILITIAIIMVIVIGLIHVQPNNYYYYEQS